MRYIIEDILIIVLVYSIALTAVYFVNHYLGSMVAEFYIFAEQLAYTGAKFLKICAFF